MSRRRTIKRTALFWLYRKSGRLYLRCLQARCFPRTVRLPDRYERQLLAGDLDGSAILEIGCGIYAEPVSRTL